MKNITPYQAVLDALNAYKTECKEQGIKPDLNRISALNAALSIIARG